MSDLLSADLSLQNPHTDTPALLTPLMKTFVAWKQRSYLPHTRSVRIVAVNVAFVSMSLTVLLNVPLSNAGCTSIHSKIVSPLNFTRQESDRRDNLRCTSAFCKSKGIKPFPPVIIILDIFHLNIQKMIRHLQHHLANTL